MKFFGEFDEQEQIIWFIYIAMWMQHFLFNFDERVRMTVSASIDQEGRVKNLRSVSVKSTLYIRI